MEIQSILKEMLKEADITVSQLSRATKVPSQTIHNWLAGMEPRSLKQVKKVSDYFGISIDQLCIKKAIENNEKQISPINNFEDEINAGVFEVVLRKVKRRNK